eukprot:7150438-Prymnesium_polylepis.1
MDTFFNEDLEIAEVRYNLQARAASAQYSEPSARRKATRSAWRPSTCVSTICGSSVHPRTLAANQTCAACMCDAV